MPAATQTLQPRSDHEWGQEQVGGIGVGQPLRISRLLVDRLSDVRRAAYEGHVPNLACVAVLAATPTTDSYSVPVVEDLRLAATRAGLRLEPVLVGGPSEFEIAFAAMSKAEAQAVIVQGLFDPHRMILLELAAKHRLAYMSSNREAVAAGGLVSISANYSVLYERAASYVDKIIKGAKPATLPVEQPTKFQVVINMKTAQALGLAAR
jgi:putative ABC transport system substrate-binding protein